MNGLSPQCRGPLVVATGVFGKHSAGFIFFMAFPPFLGFFFFLPVFVLFCFVLFFFFFFFFFFLGYDEFLTGL